VRIGIDYESARAHPRRLLLVAARIARAGEDVAARNQEERQAEASSEYVERMR
jgi:hypothetical protein